MPKVIHVIRKFEPAEWGGTETFLVNLVRELAPLGWMSEVHAPLEPGTDGTELERAGATFRTFRASYPVLGLDAEGRKRLVASGGNLVTPGELWRLTVDRRASLFHVHTTRRLGGVVRWAARRSGRPYAVTLHGPTRSGAAPGQAASFAGRGVDVGAPFGLLVGARRVVPDADLVFVLNPEERQAWEQDRRGRHLELVPHGVQTARSSREARDEARASVPGLGGAPFLVVLGRLDPMKGQDVAVRAFQLAPPAGRHLVLAGSETDAPFARAVRDLASSTPGLVHVIGGVTPRLARAFLAEAEIALVPSRAEAFGLVLLEAWAEGAPALFSSASGLKGIADACGAGRLLVDSLEPAEWSARLSAAVADPDLLASERAEAPGRVAERFSWRRVAERVAGAYEQALRGRES